MTQQKQKKSIDVLAAELVKRGWSLQEAVINSKKYVTFSKNGYSWTTRRAVVAYPFVSNEIRLLAEDKTKSAQIAKKCGANIPTSLEVRQADSLQLAQEFMKNHKTVIVKPLNSSASQGLTLSIVTNEGLAQALELAFSVSDVALVQEQVLGEELRFTVLDGKVISIIQKQTPRLIGDGIMTVAELLNRENTLRTNINTPIVYSSLELPTYIDPGLVPKEDEVVSLGSSSLVSKGASLYELSEQVHDSYKNFAITTARLLNAEFIIIDILATEWTKPATKENWNFLELNTGPALSMYYSCRNNQVTDITRLLANKLDRLTL